MIKAAVEWTMTKALGMARMETARMRRMNGIQSGDDIQDHSNYSQVPSFPRMPRDQRLIINTRDHTAFREFKVGKQLDKDAYSEALHQKDHTAMTKKRLEAIITGRSV